METLRSTLVLLGLIALLLPIEGRAETENSPSPSIRSQRAGSRAGSGSNALKRPLYTRYLGNAPRRFETDWSNGFNGISHDETHWYLTQAKYLYRTPLSKTLNRNLKKTGEPYAKLREIPDLQSYDHFGDISVYESGGRRYVLVPVDASMKPSGFWKGARHAMPAKLAIFRADRTLDFVRATDFPGQVAEGGSGQAGFVAVDSRGRIYSMRNNGLCEQPPSAAKSSCLRRYAANWNAVEGDGHDFRLRFEREIPLFDKGGIPIFLESMQGGDVAHQDRVIYLLNGYKCSANEGLHVFDLATGRMLASSRTDKGFEFEHDCRGRKIYEEPEGLTVWDLNGVENPDGMRGQLHVMLMKNQADANNLWLKHYTTQVEARDHRDNSVTKGAEAVPGGLPNNGDPHPTNPSLVWVDDGKIPGHWKRRPASSHTSPSGPALVPLKLYWSDKRGDNFTTASSAGERDAKKAGYQFVRVEACVLEKQQTGSHALKSFWSQDRGDNFTTATPQGEKNAKSAGYRYTRTDGWVYPTQQPDTVPLRLYWHTGRGDNFTAATAKGQKDATGAGYRSAGIEGYAYPASDCAD